MEEANTSKFKILSGNGLKIIAIVTMLIDHIGAIVIENGILKIRDVTDFNVFFQSKYMTFWWGMDMILRMIGRIAFPIFCFLLVEGFLHTRNPKKYACRLLLFCFISEIPFDLALWGTWFYAGYQNVYFTLFIGLLALMGMKKYQDSTWKPAVVVLACSIGAFLLKTDYGAFGVLLIVLLYWLRDQVRMQTILGCISVAWEVTAPLAFIPIRMYNGKRGKWNLKYLFYAFYPAHIFVLWVIQVIYFP